MSTKSKVRELTSEEKGRWAFLNQWELKEQSNDRMQVIGAVTKQENRLPQRSVSRRQHQLNYKRWSQERTD